MSQKRNIGRKFTVDLGDDDDDDNFVSEDDFENMEDIQNFTLAELFTRAENRRAGREHDNVEERQSLRSLTQENTLSNSGAFN